MCENPRLETIPMDETEYDCVDCGQHVVAWEFYGTTEPGKRCNSCDWIRDHVAPEHHAAVRERLGVPLAGSTDG
jgi:DNA-directed RNA polymerase subunit RPC12/RpoP